MSSLAQAGKCNFNKYHSRINKFYSSSVCQRTIRNGSFVIRKEGNAEKNIPGGVKNTGIRERKEEVSPKSQIISGRLKATEKNINGNQ